MRRTLVVSSLGASHRARIVAFTPILSGFALMLILLSATSGPRLFGADSPTPTTTTSATIAPTTTRVARQTPRDPLTGLPSYGEMLRRTAYTLFAIIAALLIAAKVIPRWLGRPRFTARGKTIEVIEAHRLEPRKVIYLIRVAGQYLLIGSTPDGLETLSGGPLDQEKLASLLKPQNSPTPSPSLEPIKESQSEKRQFLEVLRGKRGSGEIE